MRRHPNKRTPILILLCLFLVGGWATNLAIAQDQPTPAPSRWPMQVTTSDGEQVVIFQPQIDTFQTNQLTSHAAVSVTMPGSTTPIFGAIWLAARVDVDRVNRTVQILDVQVTNTKFPDATPVAAPSLDAAVRQVLLANRISLSLDHLLTSLEVIQQQQSASAQIQSVPPAIIFLQHPAMLVLYDGTPQLMQVVNSDLMTVVNTPFFVALDPGSKAYFLKGGGRWFSAPDPMGPFAATSQTPPAISTLADEMGYKDPQTPITDAQYAGMQIVTATMPTELIWSDGPQQMATIPGTGLLYVTNTTSDVFIDIASQQMYVLLSGRWFVGPNVNGPWTFVPPDKLPPDFAKIPPDSPKGDVLAFVAGTPQAQDAVANTAIPQTAAIDRNNFQQPDVEYDGDPQFEQIPGSALSYAVNTPNCVLLLNGEYYCCDNAVWYQSNSPLGPWQLCLQVPSDIYTIPPSCPDYPCTYVYDYGYTPDELYCGYLPGYTGCYPYDGCVVYGTGYYYHPWLGHHFYERPRTFGFHARYDPYTSQWGFNFGLGTEGRGGAAWVRHDPQFSEHGGQWFGFGGYRPTYTRQELTDEQLKSPSKLPPRDVFGRNVYQRRNDLRPDVPGVPKSATPPPEAHVAPQPEIRNDVYADQQGHVYRKTDQGWESRQDNDWRPAPTPPNEPSRVTPPHEQAPEAPPGRVEPMRQPEQPQEQRPAEEPRNSPPPPPDDRTVRDSQAREGGDQRAQQQAPPPQSGGGGGGGRRR